MTFGKLRVIERGPNSRNIARWYCECECGERCLVQGSALRSGRRTHCGCVGYAETRKMVGAKSRDKKAIRRRRSGKYIGVFQRSETSFMAYINANGKQIILGTFRSELLAAEAYDKKARELLGDNVPLNFGNEYDD